jgi:hypothetical protein
MLIFIIPFYAPEETCVIWFALSAIFLEFVNQAFYFISHCGAIFQCLPTILAKGPMR